MARNINSRTNLYAASAQWAHRPDEDRYWDLAELEGKLESDRLNEKEYNFSMRDLSIVGDDTNNLMFETKNGQQLQLTNWSFTQTCDQLGLASSMVKSFTMPTIQAIMRERMYQTTQATPVVGDDAAEDDWEILDESATEAPSNDDGMLKLLVKKNGVYSVRSVTSTGYGRKWNGDIVRLLREVAEPYGWRNPPARPAHADAARTRVATEDDVLKNQSNGLSVKVGDVIGPAGLYLNDRNMFIFLVDDSNPIDDGSEGGLKRGFYISNSEVGEKRTLRATFFGYKSICGNHIIHSASNVVNIKLKHTKNSIARFDDTFVKALGNYSNGDKYTESLMIQAARKQILGKDKEECVTNVYNGFKSKHPILSKRILESAYDLAAQWEHRYNTPPNTVYGLTNGLTMASQHTKFADVRNSIDLVGGSLMESVRIADAPMSVSPQLAIESDSGDVKPARKSKK